MAKLGGKDAKTTSCRKSILFTILYSRKCSTPERENSKIIYQNSDELRDEAWWTIGFPHFRACRSSWNWACKVSLFAELAGRCFNGTIVYFTEIYPAKMGISTETTRQKSNMASWEIFHFDDFQSHKPTFKGEFPLPRLMTGRWYLFWGKTVYCAREHSKWATSSNIQTATLKSKYEWRLRWYGRSWVVADILIPSLDIASMSSGLALLRL